MPRVTFFSSIVLFSVTIFSPGAESLSLGVIEKENPLLDSAVFVSEPTILGQLQTEINAPKKDKKTTPKKDQKTTPTAPKTD